MNTINLFIFILLVLFLFLLKFFELDVQFIKNNEFYIQLEDIIDISNYDTQNVHQRSIEDKTIVEINKLMESHKLYELSADKIIEIKEEMLKKIKNKHIVELIFSMSLKYLNISEDFILCLIWTHIKHDDQMIEMFDKNLEECLDEDLQIRCEIGRVPQLLQTIGVNFVPLYVYKEEIINSILYYKNKLSEFYPIYRTLENKETLTTYEKNKLTIYNIKFIQFLNKKFSKYLENNSIDYKTLRIILLPNYKELFREYNFF